MTKKKTTVTDVEATVDLRGSSPDLPLRDDASSEPHLEAEPVTESEDPHTEPSVAAIAAPEADPDTARKHLRGLVEALVFASEQPIKPADIGKLAQAPTRQIKEVLEELKADFAGRGIQLEEIAGGYAFRTNMAFAPFVRDLVGQKPVRLTRAQLETLAIVAYRQPITRPDVDDVRGVDCGPVLRTLLERDLVRILGKKDEPGRPILYGTSSGFLELFGLKSLKDLPTLREFTELNEDSKRTVERELGDAMETQLGGGAPDKEGDRPTMESVGVAHVHSEAAPANETEHAHEEQGELTPDEDAEPAPAGAGEAAADDDEDEDDEDEDDEDDEDEDDEDEDDEDEA